jgi:hypothetical protein
MTTDTNTNSAGAPSGAIVTAPPTGSTGSTQSDLPPNFETSLQDMLKDYPAHIEPSLTAILGAAVLQLGKIETLLTNIVDPGSGSGSGSGPIPVPFSVPKLGASPTGVRVKVALEPELQSYVVSKLDALNETVAHEGADLTGLHEQIGEFQTWQAEADKRAARIEEHLGHLRAGHENLAKQAAILAESLQKEAAAIKKDHRKFTEEFAAFGQRLEALEHKSGTRR